MIVVRSKIIHGVSIPMQQIFEHKIVRFILQRRVFNLIGFLACVGLICAAYFFQYFEGEDPCPLCLFQRYGIALVGLVFLFAAISHPNRVLFARVFSVLLLVAAIAGGSVSGKHIWIQSLPEDEVPECTPPLDFMVEMDGWVQTVKIVLLKGTGDCHDSSWKFLSLTMPMWVLLWFVGLGVGGFARNWIPDKKLGY